MKNILAFIILMSGFSLFGQIQEVNIGTAPNDGTGDNLRDAFNKMNNNDNYLDGEITALDSELDLKASQQALEDTAAAIRADITSGSGNPILTNVTVYDTTRWGDTVNAISYGTEGQLPIVNASGDGFNFTTRLTYDGENLNIDDAYQSTASLSFGSASEVQLLYDTQDELHGVHNNVVTWTATPNMFGFYIPERPTFYNRSRSTTLPNILPDRDNLSTGINSSSDSLLYLISRGALGLVIDSDTTKVNNLSIDDTLYFSGTPLGLSDIIGGGAGLSKAQIEATDFDSLRAITYHNLPYFQAIALSDSSSSIDVGDGDSWHTMANYTIDSIMIGTNTAPTGSTIVVDVLVNGSSILSTDITIDAGERTSLTAATPYVISDSDISFNDIITIDVTQVGLTIAGAGLKFYLWGTLNN